MIHCVSFTFSFHALWTSCKNLSAWGFSGTSTFAHRKSQNLWMPNTRYTASSSSWTPLAPDKLGNTNQRPSLGCSAYASHHFACPGRFALVGWGSIKTWYAPSKSLFHIFFPHAVCPPAATRKEKTQRWWQSAIFLGYCRAASQIHAPLAVTLTPPHPRMTQFGISDILCTCAYFWFAKTWNIPRGCCVQLAPLGKALTAGLGEIAGYHNSAYSPIY